MHTLVSRDGDGWSALRRDHETIDWYMVCKETRGRLQHAVEASLDLDPLKHAWTFSERQAEEVIANLAESPDQIPHVDRSLDICIYLREGRFEPEQDRWATANRSPGEIWIWSMGLDAVFQSKTLRSQIVNGFFGFERDEKHAKSFIGGKSGIEKPSHRRELWVRPGPGWLARELCSNAFPIFRPGPVVSDEQAARRISKMPQNKNAVRRAKHQANDARFKAEAAERARQREAAQ